MRTVFDKIYTLGLQQQFSPPISVTFGGKNSSVGKSSRLNISHGLSDEVVHSFSGMQKSYVGTSICTLRSIWTIVKIPIVTNTSFSPFAPSSPP